MTEHGREAITWNSKLLRFDWSVTLPGDKTISGFADSYDQARHQMETDWRVRGDSPRHVRRISFGCSVELPGQ